MSKWSWAIAFGLGALANGVIGVLAMLDDCLPAAALFWILCGASILQCIMSAEDVRAERKAGMKCTDN